MKDSSECDRLEQEFYCLSQQSLYFQCNKQMCQAEKTSVIGLFDAMNLDKVCIADRIKTWLFWLSSETWLSG